MSSSLGRRLERAVDDARLRGWVSRCAYQVSPVRRKDACAVDPGQDVCVRTIVLASLVWISIATPASARVRKPLLVAESTSLRVASWNVKRLGHGTKNLKIVADIINDFDVVAVQEVMTRAAVEALDMNLPDHKVLLTDVATPQRGSYREYFAYFYRPSRLTPVMNTFVPDPKDAFLRDPYLGCFVAVGSPMRLCLMTVHIVFGKRVAVRKTEILALDDALRWAQKADEAAAWIVLGDFNRPVDDGDSDTDPEVEWRELLDRRRLREPVVLAGRELPTTLGKSGYANSYDHIFVSIGLYGRVADAGRVDIVSEACGGSFARCRGNVSDHAPVFVEIQPWP
ncbi:MAG: endonuclease/exonuclease/phosphatase family protein [Nannocystaceae bacterium]